VFPLAPPTACASRKSPWCRPPPMHGRYPFFKHRRKPRTEKHWRGSKPRGPVTEAPTYIHMYIQGPGTPSTRPCLGTSQKPIETTLSKGIPGGSPEKDQGREKPQKQTDRRPGKQYKLSELFFLLNGWFHFCAFSPCPRRPHNANRYYTRS
jgi:hypothetical protein